MTKDQFAHWLRSQVKKHGSQKKLAEVIGVSPQYLGDILAGRREPGEKLLAGCGFRRIVTYERIYDGH